MKLNRNDLDSFSFFLRKNKIKKPKGMEIYSSSIYLCKGASTSLSWNAYETDENTLRLICKLLSEILCIELEFVGDVKC